MARRTFAVLFTLLGIAVFVSIVGFALLARHFEESHVPLVLPRFLPDDWKGGFALLAAVFVLSSFLDNIAAALIGGTMAQQVFRGKVHIGYLAAIVAASNAGGSGSVVGDTTTTYSGAGCAAGTSAPQTALGAFEISPFIRKASGDQRGDVRPRFARIHADQDTRLWIGFEQVLAQRPRNPIQGGVV